VTTTSILSVEFAVSDPAIAYAAGEFFYRSTDGGETWHRLAGNFLDKWGPPNYRPGAPIDIQVDPRDPWRLFTNNYGGDNFLSADGGEHWVSSSAGYTGAELTSIAVSPDDSDIVYTNGRNGPFRSTDGGASWIGINPGNPPIDEGARIAVDPTDGDHVLVGCTQWGWTVESTDGGLHWLPILDQRGVSLLEVYEERIARAGETCAVCRFQGMWAIVFSPADPRRVYGGYGIQRCAQFAESDHCAGRTVVGFLISDDGGHFWREVQGTSLDGLSISAIAPHPTDVDTAWAATVGQGVYKTSDGGATWSRTSNGLADKRVMALIIDARTGTLFAGTAEAGVWRSEDGGKSWQRRSSGMNPTEPVGALVIDPARPDTLYAGSWQSGASVSRNAGGSWQRMNDGLRTRSVSALAISVDGATLYAATRGEGVFRLDLGSAGG
jgi:photosystem II stability/assembly factor-like uncharacterized protein